MSSLFKCSYGYQNGSKLPFSEKLFRQETSDKSSANCFGKKPRTSHPLTIKARHLGQVIRYGQDTLGRWYTGKKPLFLLFLQWTTSKHYTSPEINASVPRKYYNPKGDRGKKNSYPGKKWLRVNIFEFLSFCIKEMVLPSTLYVSLEQTYLW